MKTPDLKPCPFCGGEVFIGIWEEPWNQKKYHITCFNEHCYIRPGTDYHRDKEVVIEEWNRRVTDENA